MGDGAGPRSAALPVPASYRRSVGSPRGEARREDLLTRVTDDLLRHGLTDFSLRRAARAAGTTHKVLLYHFDSAPDLLAQAVNQLRARRISGGLAAALDPPNASLVERVRRIWPVLVGVEADALDQAMGLAMYDPDRYGQLTRGATEQYLQALRGVCPNQWSDRRKVEVSTLILASLRGLVLARRTSGGTQDVGAGLEALERALEREQASP